MRCKANSLVPITFDHSSSSSSSKIPSTSRRSYPSTLHHTIHPKANTLSSLLDIANLHGQLSHRDPLHCKKITNHVTSNYTISTNWYRNRSQNRPVLETSGRSALRSRVQSLVDLKIVFAIRRVFKAPGHCLNKILSKVLKIYFTLIDPLPAYVVHERSSRC